MDVLPPLRLMLERDPELRVTLVREADLDAEDLAFLLNSKVDSKEVKEALEQATVKREIKVHPKVVEEVKEETKEEPVEIKPQPKKGQKSLFDF